ncbi:MAG: hypothetical protein ACI9SF_000285 [Candidatus Nanohaloarchaea archaeon]|jgi:hypothetical protein
MSIQEKKEEAEAVLDSAEMVLETIPEPRTGKAKDLEIEINKLEEEIQDPDSESSLEELIQSVRDLMDEVQEDAMQDPMEPGDDMGGGMGPGGAPPGGPEDDVPPF